MKIEKSKEKLLPKNNKAKKKWPVLEKRHKKHNQGEKFKKVRKKMKN